MANPNQGIIAALGTIADNYKNSGVIHKYKAYRTAMDTIRNWEGGEITSATQLKGAKGIGKAMLEKVDEIIKTGSLQQEKEVLKDPVAAALKDISAVHGVGPKLAATLVHEKGLRSVEELERRAKELNLPAQVKLGLKYHEESQVRIPYAEVRHHYNYIRELAHTQIDQNLILEVCGSHRRGGATSGDIDVLVTHPCSHSETTQAAQVTFLRALTKVLRDSGYLVDTLVEGPSKFMGYCRLNVPVAEDEYDEEEEDAVPGPPKTSCTTRRLDLRWMFYNHYYSSLLYFTGSDMFNISMRTEALKLGYSLNEYGIFKLPKVGDDPATAAARAGSPNRGGGQTNIYMPASSVVDKQYLEVNSEQDIFKILGMKYVNPRERCK